jgi:hypothetical protein
VTVRAQDQGRIPEAALDLAAVLAEVQDMIDRTVSREQGAGALVELRLDSAAVLAEWMGATEAAREVDRRVARAQALVDAGWQLHWKGGRTPCDAGWSLGGSTQ